MTADPRVCDRITRVIRETLGVEVPSHDTDLIDSGLLDSLGLVTLIVDVEQDLADQAGITVTLGDDRAVSARHSPFRTVGSLAEYALERIGQHA